MNELWKDVKGYEGLYQVSSLGRVRSVDHDVKRPQNTGKTLIKGKILKASPHEQGYPRVNLCCNGKMKSKYVHILVLEAFKCMRPNKQDVDHIDGNRSNNKLSNLRWLSYRENRGQSDYKNPNKKINKYKRTREK